MQNWRRNILLFLAFLIGFPSLFVIWAFVDDGHSFWVSQKMTSALLSGDVPLFVRQIIEPELGILRPFYWIYQWFTFIVAGRSHFLHHLIHFGVFILSSFLLFKIVKLISKSLNAAFLSGLFFVVNLINIENWYRLGPQEPLLVLLQITSIYCLLKSPRVIYFLLSLIFLLFFYFTKAISLAFIPISFFIWLTVSLTEKEKLSPQNFKNRFLIYFLANVVFGTLARGLNVMLGIPPGSYASFYKPNLPRMISNSLLYVKHIVGVYDPLFSFACLTFSIRFFSSLKNRLLRLDRVLLWQITFLVWLASFILIQSPWEFVLSRYFLPASIGLAVFLGIEYSHLFEFLDNILRNRSFPKDLKLFCKSLKVILIILFVIVFIYNGIAIGNYIQSVVSDFDEQMLTFLAEKTPRNGNIYFNFVGGDANLELYYEIPLHLKLFYDREDIEFAHLDFNEKEKFNLGDIIVSGNGVPAYSEEEIATYSGILRIKHFRRKVSNLVTIRPMNIIKRLILFQNPLIGLYSLSHNYYNWYIYQFTNK